MAQVFQSRHHLSFTDAVGDLGCVHLHVAQFLNELAGFFAMLFDAIHQFDFQLIQFAVAGYFSVLVFHFFYLMRV